MLRADRMRQSVSRSLRSQQQDSNLFLALVRESPTVRAVAEDSLLDPPQNTQEAVETARVLYPGNANNSGDA